MRINLVSGNQKIEEDIGNISRVGAGRFVYTDRFV